MKSGGLLGVVGGWAGMSKEEEGPNEHWCWWVDIKRFYFEGKKKTRIGPPVVLLLFFAPTVSPLFFLSVSLFFLFLFLLLPIIVF